MRKNRIICYGLGEGYKDFLLHINHDAVEIVGVIDKNTPFDGVKYPIISLAEIKNVDFDYVVICSRNHFNEIGEELLKHINISQIVAAPNCVSLNNKYQNNDLMAKILNPTYVNGYLVWGHNLPFKNTDNSDYIRKSTLGEILKMIKKYNVDGQLAELGVCTGAFAKLLNEFFPEKKLYLFDTFEGFDERDLNREGEFNKDVIAIQKVITGVKQTAVDVVLNCMPYKDNCLICKGYFPETASMVDNNEHFSFVSIDADLYNPILAGLQFFYPRMSRNGVIMIHDYNSFWSGAAEAVDEFCKENNLIPIPVSDECGSVLIIKK